MSKFIPMASVIPSLPILPKRLRRRLAPEMTAVADAMLLLALAIICFPHHRWICPVAVLAALAPLWINAFSSRRTGPFSVFAPDPLAPDFGSFLSSFATSAEQVASGEKKRAVWTLCPVCTRNGQFQPYTLDFSPAKHAILLKAANGVCKTESEVLFRPRLALPVTVTDTPVRIKLSPSGTKQVLLSENAPAHLLWNRPYGNGMRDELVKGILSVALLTYAFFPESSVLTPDRLAIFTAVLLLVLFEAK